MWTAGQPVVPVAAGFAAGVVEPVLPAFDVPGSDFAGVVESADVFVSLDVDESLLLLASDFVVDVLLLRLSVL
jgi:hypothetical protein